MHTNLDFGNNTIEIDLLGGLRESRNKKNGDSCNVRIRMDRSREIAIQSSYVYVRGTQRYMVVTSSGDDVISICRPKMEQQSNCRRRWLGAQPSNWNWFSEDQAHYRRGPSKNKLKQLQLLLYNAHSSLIIGNMNCEQ